MLRSSEALRASGQEKIQEPAIDAGRHTLVAPLVDGLLHEARNPLNAISINIEVLAERLKRELGGSLPASHEKSIRSIREQVLRVDEMLRAFADFLSPRRSGRTDVDFGLLVSRACEVLGHESRKRRVPLRASVDPNARIDGESAALSFVAIQPILRALQRSAAGADVHVSLRSEEGKWVYRVEDGGPQVGDEPSMHALQALSATVHENGGRIDVRGRVTEVQWSSRNRLAGREGEHL